MSAIRPEPGGSPGDRAVVVGASLAGLHGAEAIRRAGFVGRLTIVGAEPHAPYDRPPLSKHVLTGKVAPDATTLPITVELDAEWRLGVAAVSLGRADGVLRLSDGSSLGYDKLLIATGTRAREWPDGDQGRLEGVYTLRGRGDAAALRTALAAKPRRVLVIGTGFIGCEVAAACRSLDLTVSLVAPSPPLVRVLGSYLGAVVRKMHETRGVDMRHGTKVERLEGDGEGRLTRAYLADGTSIAVDVAVVALGAVRNTEWLEGSGLSSDVGGVDCGADGYVLDDAGRPDRRISAAGDVARFPHPLYDGRRVAVEHWSNAVAQGAHAGRLLAGVEPERPYAEMPTFWSTQYGVNIKSLGLTDGADGLVIAQGSVRSGRFLALYGREGRCIAAVSFDSGRWLPVYAEMIGSRAPFPPHGASVDRTGRLDVLDPAFPAHA